MMKTIELDCAPGAPRPGDLIEGVIAGTGLQVKEPAAMFFGQWTWDYSEVPDEQWAKAQAVTKPRIEALYHAGCIRYGSW
jgi:hypothetical protein